MGIRRKTFGSQKENERYRKAETAKRKEQDEWYESRRKWKDSGMEYGHPRFTNKQATMFLGRKKKPSEARKAKKVARQAASKAPHLKKKTGTKPGRSIDPKLYGDMLGE